jgi:hypothetical protein
MREPEEDKTKPASDSTEYSGFMMCVSSSHFRLRRSVSLFLKLLKELSPLKCSATHNYLRKGSIWAPLYNYTGLSLHVAFYTAFKVYILLSFVVVSETGPFFFFVIIYSS